jgi:hypothetical protein
MADHVPHRCFGPHSNKGLVGGTYRRLVAEEGATDQYEGYVPTRSVEGCDLLSAGGACGEVVSKHTSMVDPTRLGIVGLVSDKHELPINQRAFGLPPHAVGESLETGFDLARLPRAASGELLFAWRDDRGQGERRSPKNPCPNTPAR